MMSLNYHKKLIVNIKRLQGENPKLPGLRFHCNRYLKSKKIATFCGLHELKNYNYN